MCEVRQIYLHLSLIFNLIFAILILSFKIWSNFWKILPFFTDNIGKKNPNLKTNLFQITSKINIDVQTHTEKCKTRLVSADFR